MHSSSTERWLIDIRHNIVLAQSFIEGVSYEAFCESQLVFYGLTRCLEIVSEASRRLPEDLKSRHANIPWAEMAGAGNVYRHDYEDVQHRLVWGTAKTRLPELLATVEWELGIRAGRP